MIILLFFSFVQIGAFSFGGGYAALPLITQQVVHAHHWLTMEQMSQLVVLSQMTPGPIAINAATFVGQRVAGVPGAIAATMGCVFPSLCIVSLLAFLYVRYRKLTLFQSILSSLRPIVVGLIASSAYSIFLSSCSLDVGFTVLVFLLCLYLLLKKKTSPIWVMVLSGSIYVVLQLIGLK